MSHSANFLLAARISEVVVYDWVPLKDRNVMIIVKLWNDDSLAMGELAMVCVKAKGVPKSMKNFHGLYKIGSLIGLRG